MVRLGKRVLVACENESKRYGESLGFHGDLREKLKQMVPSVAQRSRCRGSVLRGVYNGSGTIPMANGNCANVKRGPCVCKSGSDAAASCGVTHVYLR